MVRLNLPSYDHQVIRQDGKLYIYDIIRKKYVMLLPEEWVRQHMVHYLIHHCGYPASLMRIEQTLHQRGRADIISYQSTGNIYMIMECKSPKETMQQEYLAQLARYHGHTHAPYIAITNGLQHFVFSRQKEGKGYRLLPKIPPYCRELPI